MNRGGLYYLFSYFYHIIHLFNKIEFMQTYSEITFKCIILKLNLVLLKYKIYVGFMYFKFLKFTIDFS